MEYTVLASGALLLIGVILILWKPWKGLDLTSREEIDDTVKPLVEPISKSVGEIVEQVSKEKRVARRRKPKCNDCEVPVLTTAEPVKTVKKK